MILLCTAISNGCCAWPHGQCVCIYVVDSSKRQEEAMNTRRQSLSSCRRVMVYFTGGTRGHGTDGLTSPPKDS